MADYEAIIGMEVHAQLLTDSKVFCGCDASVFGAEPNTHVCPVCLGMPGVLPVLNRRAAEQTIMVGLALKCEIAETAVFSRKNYFYPDLPKAYQISMYDFPLCQHGWIEIEDPQGPRSGDLRSTGEGRSGDLRSTGGLWSGDLRQTSEPGDLWPTDERGDPYRTAATRRIGIRRVHLEEETAKSFHAGEHSLVDFNRAGLPLIEIVTEPEIRTPEEARQYLVKLQMILRYLGVSTGDMEKGAMRCEPNVSVRLTGTEEFGTKVEVKNLNSFRSVKLALEHEIARQARVLDDGQRVRQVTMGWNERRGRTVEQRTKEEADDYRYFPEPDLPPLRISRVWVDEIRARLPELPDQKVARFTAEYGLSPTDAGVLTADRDVAAYYEEAVAAGQGGGISPKVVSNWMTGEVFRLLGAQDIAISQISVSPAALVQLITMVEDGTITSNSSKVVLGEMLATGRPADEIVAAKGLAQVSDEQALAQIVDEVIAANPEQVARYRAGKETLLQWFVGQVMRATRGKAHPQVARTLLENRLGE